MRDCDGCHEQSERLLNNNQTVEDLCVTCFSGRQAEDENFLRFCNFCETERYETIDDNLPFKLQCMECLAWACPECAADEDPLPLCSDCYETIMAKD